MFFDTPLHALLEQAAARPDQLREHYAALLAEIGHRDATLRSMCDPSREWLVSELDRIGARPVSKSNQGLFGLPVGVKDTIVVAGLPTKAGTPADVGQLLRLPQSPAVTALRKAGAVIVAKQETNQFCSSAGPAPTQCIRGPAYFAGGSTVGGAVAVAAGFTRLALGSDAAGSVRHPAALAGVAGLRPRKGSLSDKGQVNGALSGQSTGLIARSATDIALILARCPSLHIEPADRPTLDKERPTIGVPDISWHDIAPAAEAALRSSVSRLMALGYRVEPTPIWMTEEAQDDFFLVMNFENWLFHKRLMTEHSEIYNPAVRDVMRAGKAIEPQQAAAARQRLFGHRQRLLDLAHAAGLDMLLTPSIPWPDIRKDAGTPRELSAIGGRFTAISNIYDFDSLSVPVERSPEGWRHSVMLHGITVPLSRLLACARHIELPQADACSQ